MEEIDTVIKAYQLYLEQTRPRAWSRCCRSPAPGAW